MVTQNKYKTSVVIAFFALSSVIIASFTYSFLYFNLIFLSTFPEENTKLIIEYKNAIAIILGLISFFSVKAYLSKQNFNPFTGIQLGILIGLPSVLTTVYLISYTL